MATIGRAISGRREQRKVHLVGRQIAELYMFFGGVAHYLDHVAKGESVAQVVDRTCFRRDGLPNGHVDDLVDRVLVLDDPING